MQPHRYSYLAIGDSYTVGESVPLADNFPHQLVRIMHENGFRVEPPQIIAATGWTTSELQSAIDILNLADKRFDFVTLLIGVNNQYRGQSIDTYAVEFERLVTQAIEFADHETSHVFVLSIPDWGVTPYAQGRDRALISKQIDQFNEVNKKISARINVNYLDITQGTREALTDPELVAIDGLHPSAKEYLRWAEKLFSQIRQYL